MRLQPKTSNKNKRNLDEDHVNHVLRQAGQRGRADASVHVLLAKPKKERLSCRNLLFFWASVESHFTTHRQPASSCHVPELSIVLVSIHGSGP